MPGIGEEYPGSKRNSQCHSGDSGTGDGWKVIPSIWVMVNSFMYQALSQPGAMLPTLHALFFLSDYNNPIYYYALLFTANKVKLREVK